MVGYAALGGRECEIAVANRAGELPGLQSRQENFRLNGDRAPAAFRLWRSDFAVAARPLPDVDLAGLEVDIVPPEATQLTGSESGQRRRQQQGAPRRSRLLRATIPRANTMTCRTRSITRITRFAAFARVQLIASGVITCPLPELGGTVPAGCTPRRPILFHSQLPRNCFTTIDN